MGPRGVLPNRLPTHFREEVSCSTTSDFFFGKLILILVGRAHDHALDFQKPVPGHERTFFDSLFLGGFGRGRFGGLFLHLFFGGVARGDAQVCPEDTS